MNANDGSATMRSGELVADESECATLTVPEAAAVLGISRSMAYELVHTGDLPALRFGRRIVVPRRSLEALLAAADPA